LKPSASATRITVAYVVEIRLRETKSAIDATRAYRFKIATATK